MAGSAMTFDYSVEDRGISRVTIAWTSDDTTGAVSGTTNRMYGRLVKAVTVPDGTAAPTNLYDIAITDEASNNVLTACDDDLADRAAAATEEVYFLVKDHAGTPLAQSIHPMVADKLTVAVSNAGNSKQGTIILYLATT